MLIEHPPTCYCYVGGRRRRRPSAVLYNQQRVPQPRDRSVRDGRLAVHLEPNLVPQCNLQSSSSSYPYCYPLTVLAADKVHKNECASGRCSSQFTHECVMCAEHDGALQQKAHSVPRFGPLRRPSVRPLLAHLPESQPFGFDQLPRLLVFPRGQLHVFDCDRRALGMSHEVLKINRQR